MTSSAERPEWVIEQLLDFDPFDCCGDEDLFPFKCSSCDTPMVLCYECDTLYADLPNLQHQLSIGGETRRCPVCGALFSSDLMREPKHRITFEEWSRHGLDHLLVNRSPQELAQWLSASAELISQFLFRGMRSTARMRLIAFRNLAEAIANLTPGVDVIRDRGLEIASSSYIRDALAWSGTIADRTERAYAVLGITDAVFPAT
jgi:hypothetical protein